MGLADVCRDRVYYYFKNRKENKEIIVLRVTVEKHPVKVKKDKQKRWRGMRKTEVEREERRRLTI